MDKVLDIVAVIGPVVSAVLVAVFNNWEKINPGKRDIKDVKKIAMETQADVTLLKAQMQKMSSAQRTGLQTQILEKSRRIQLAIEAGDKDYSEELKQLIILYREYYLCGFNNQGRLYFNDTIDKASADNNVLVRDLMNTYFSEYNPESEVHHE